ncbi:MAG: hypothetical protein R2713_00990 [Ilumatobacteraceae bacterium]
MVSSAVRDEYSAIHGRDPDEIVAELSRSGRRGPERMLDLMLQTGPLFGAALPGAGLDDGASLDLLLKYPHGVDFGPAAAAAAGGAPDPVGDGGARPSGAGG